MLFFFCTDAEVLHGLEENDAFHVTSGQELASSPLRFPGWDKSRAQEDFPSVEGLCLHLYLK